MSTGPMVYPSSMEPVELDMVVDVEVLEVNASGPNASSPYVRVKLVTRNSAGDVIFGVQERVLYDGDSLQARGFIVLVPKGGG